MSPAPVGPRSFLRYRNFRHLKLGALGLGLALAVYLAHDPPGGRNGGSAVGYTLGALCAGLILWLLWFGVRKRAYGSKGGSLQGWLSAHVYLGITLLLLVPLHCAFQFGWNVHTAAYALMAFVIFSGMAGVAFYAFVPERMTELRRGQRVEALHEQIADLDSECRALAKALPDHYARATALAIEETHIGGPLWRQLAGRDPDCGTTRALEMIREDVADLDAGESAQSKRLRELLARKSALLQRLRRDVRYRALVSSWLLLHIPLSVAALVAVVVHVFSVFYFW